MKYRHPVTPIDPMSSFAQEIKKKLKIKEDPVYIDVELSKHAIVNECFANTSSQVDLNGGQQVLGWALWELPGVYFEAEFHAVWERPDGVLIDITPKKELTSRILFLRDPGTSYTGEQVDNLRLPISNDPAVMDFIQASEEEVKFMNEGSRQGQYGEITLTENEAAHYDQIQQRKTMATLGCIRLLQEIGPYTPCSCGCGRKTKWCDKRKL
ncbi:hypothetical protein ACFIQF_07910 [Comamonas sp. J-3]|uniref:hypothetical protein n=1 Tax=Comamonas trifloxystrobinivorans TaxID=3350256 RepID=UPI00372A026A